MCNPIYTHWKLAKMAEPAYLVYLDLHGPRYLHVFILITKNELLFYFLTLFKLDPDTCIILNLLDHLSIPADDDTDSKSGYNHLDEFKTNLILYTYKKNKKHTCLRQQQHYLHPDCFHPFWIQSLPCQPWSLLGLCHGWVSPQVHGLAIKNKKNKFF